MWTALLILTVGMTIAGSIIVGAVAWQRFRLEYGHANLSGAEARVIDWRGTQGRVHVRGRLWPAYAADPVELRPGQKVLVSRIDNDSLKITPIEHDLETIDS